MNTNISRQKYTGKNSITVNEQYGNNATNLKDRKRDEQKNEESSEGKQNEDSDEGILVVNRTLKSKIFLEEKQTNKNEKSFIKKKEASTINIPSKSGKKEILSVNANDKKIKKNLTDTAAKKEVKKINVISDKLEEKEHLKTYNSNNTNSKLEKETIKNALVTSKSKLKTRKETDQENQKEKRNEYEKKNYNNAFIKINTRKENVNEKDLNKEAEKEENEKDENETNNIKENSLNSYNRNEINTSITNLGKTNNLCNLLIHSKLSTNQNMEYGTADQYLIGKKKSEDIAYFDEYIKKQNEEAQKKKELYGRNFLTENKLVQAPFKNDNETKKTEVDREKTNGETQKEEAGITEIREFGKVIKYDNFALAEIDKELEKINEEENKIQEELVRLTDLELQLFIKRKNAERQKLSLERKNEHIAKKKSEMENNKKEYQME